MSRQLANDKGNNEIIPGALHRSPSIYQSAEENLRKMSMKTLKWGPLPPNEKGRIAQHARKEERREEINIEIFIPFSRYFIPLITIWIKM